MNLIKLLLIVFLLSFINGCSEKTIYTGKIINQETLDYSNIKNINELINNLGKPSFIDPIENKYFYYSEKKIFKNFFNKKTTNRTLLVFEINKNGIIKNVNLYDLDDEKDFAIVNKKTKNDLLERGFIEKVFGGVGKSQELPSTP